MATEDVLIAGLGPAGLTLAAACSRRGLSVRAVDPRAGRPWSATYGMWAHQWDRARDSFPALRDVPVATTRYPQIIAPRRSAKSPVFGQASADYVVVDSPALQHALSQDLSGIMTSEEALSTDDLRAAAERGTRVVDCRGAVPPDLRGGPEERPMQTAFGVVLPRDRAVPYLPGGRGALMDWRTEALGTIGRPSFLYAVDLPGDRTLLEETDLVGAPALGIAELRARLHRRFGWTAVDAGLTGLTNHTSRAGDADTAETHMRIEDAHGVIAREKVRFPVMPAARPDGLETFGTAGDAGHPATGYSIGEILRSADAAAHALAAELPIPPSTGVGTRALHRMGLRALLGIDRPALQEMFAGFAELDVRRQQAFLSRNTGAFPTASAMAAQWWKTTNATRAVVARAALVGR